MTVSVIIPTLNRVKDLRLALGTLLVQTCMPSQVVVVDQSTDALSRELCAELAPQFAAKGSRLEYLYQEEKSLVKARNRGLRAATGDLLSFLDDDIELYPDYFEKILPYFEKDPALGAVNGSVLESEKGFHGWKWALRKGLWRLFLLNFMNGKMTPSGFGYPVYERSIERVLPVEMLHGCNMNVRRGCIPDLEFDEWFTGYSYREDVDFSYRVFLGTRNMIMVPDAKLYHHVSPSNRLDLEELRRMQIRNYHYLFRKFKRRGPLSTLLFLYSLSGSLLLDGVEALTNRKDRVRKWSKLRGGWKEALAILKKGL